MSSTVTKALRGLYKKMTNNEAAGNSTVKVLNEIATAMGATSKHTSVTQCIDEITANYSASGSSDFTTAEVTIHFTFEEYADDLTNVVCNVPNGLTNSGIMMAMQSAMSNINAGATSADFTYTMPLYKNSTSIVVAWVNVVADDVRLQFDYGGTVTATGNATVGVDNISVTVTGDCTITIPLAVPY